MTRLLAMLLMAALLCPAELPALAQELAQAPAEEIVQPEEPQEPDAGQEVTEMPAPSAPAEGSPADPTDDPDETPEAEPTTEPTAAPTAAPTQEPEATQTAGPDGSAEPTATPIVTDAPNNRNEPGTDENVFTAQPVTVAVKQKRKIALNHLPEGETCTYSTGNKAVCMVDDEGNVKGVAAGETVIRVQTSGGLTAECAVTVIAAPSKITLSQKTATVLLGETLDLDYTLPENTGADVEWRSSSSVASVDENGVVTALKAGTVTITAETHNDKTAACKITVPAAPGWIRANEEELVLGVGQKAEDLFAIEKGTRTRIVYTYQSLEEGVEAPEIFSVDGDVLTATATGEVELIATTHNGHTAAMKLTVLPAPEEFALSAQALTMGIDQKAQLTAILPEGTAAKISYSSNYPKIVKVDQQGNLKALKTGTAVITVRAHNDVAYQCTVKVVRTPWKITLDKTSTTLYPGMSEQLTYRLPSGSAASVKWSVEGKAVQVAQDGTITAIATGTATITAKTHNGKKDTLKVYVYDAPQQLEMPLQSHAMGAGQKYTLKPVTDAPHYRALRFASSDTAVLTIAANGEMKAVSRGRAMVTVSALDGSITAELPVEVFSAPAKVTLNASSVTLGIGDAFQIVPAVAEGCFEKFTYTAADKDISVSADGVVTAKRAGSSKVTVKTFNGKSAVLKVTVKAAPEWVRPAADVKIVGVGEKVEGLFTLSKNSAAILTYDIGDTTVLQMTGDGMIAAAPGAAEVKVTTHNQLTAVAKVEVRPAPETFELSAAEMELGVGQKAALQAILPEGTAAKITYASSAAKVVSVDAGGNLKAVATGTAVITVRTHNDLELQCTVAVKKAPKSVSLNDSEIVMYVGQPCTPAYTLSSGSSASVTWSVSSSKVLQVNANGSITALKPGTASLTVKTHNGKKSTRKVYCYNAPTYMELKQTSPLELGVGQKLEIRPDTDAVHYRMLRFTSSNSGVAYIAKTGMLQAKKPGRATITVRTLDDKFVRTLEVEVFAAPSSVKMSPSSVMLGLGDRYQIVPVVGANCRAGYTFKAYDSKISVDAGGMVTAKKKGTTKVLVKTHNGKSAELKITIVEPPSAISLSSTALKMEAGESATLKYTLPSGTASVINWTSSDENVCTVSTKGVVTAVNKGSATVTATTLNGLSATCSVKVVESAARIEVPDSMTVAVGEFKNIDAKAYTADGAAYEGEITAVAKDTTYAKIACDGRLYGRQAGECTIEVKAGQQTATVRVLVTSANEDSRRDIIVSSALEKLGCKYVFAKSGPDTFDCSGFVLYSYKKVGITLPHSAYKQGYERGFKLEKDELLPGDIVCFNTNLDDSDLVDHTGIYIGNNKAVHASSSAKEVIISDMSTGYYKERFVWGVRILK